MIDPRPRTRPRLLAALIAAAVPFPALAAAPAPLAVATDTWTWADAADLVLPAPLVFTARVADAIRVPDAPAGVARFYVTADVVSMIRAPGPTPPRLAWVADVALDAQGRAPRLRKQEVVVAARPVAGRPGDVQLAGPDAMRLAASVDLDRVRRILREASAPAAAPPVERVQSAFHVPGNLPGESETQIFLKTAAAPASISVLRRPGTEPAWSVAFGEVVDEAATRPARDTLAWYRLACFLPPTLDAAATAELGAADAEAARRDYAFVVESLGPCPRSRRSR